MCVYVCVSLASLNGEGVCFLSIERRQTPSLLREESVSLYIERKRDSFVIEEERVSPSCIERR